MALILGGSSALTAPWSPSAPAPMTIMAWGRRDATPTDIRTLASAGNPAQSLMFNALQTSAAPTGVAKAISFSNYAETDSASATLTAYHHMVAVFAGGGANGLRTYLDNVRTNGTWTANTDAFTALYIGRTCSVDIFEYFDGGLSHVAVWDVALTDQQVADLYNRTVNPLDVEPSNLVCYFPFVDALTDEVGDLTWTPVNLGAPTYEDSGITYPASGPGGVTGTINAVATAATAELTGSFVPSSKPETVPLTIATGAVANSATASLAITTPAGAIGDLVVFCMMHDTYGTPGAFVPSTPPVALTTIHSGVPQLGDDSRFSAFWGIEDQAEARAYTFTTSVAEDLRGFCLRFGGGIVTAAPILAGSAVRDGGPGCPALVGTKPGQIAVHCVSADASNIIPSSPEPGWTERIESNVNNNAIYCETKVLSAYPLVASSGTTGNGTSTTAPGTVSHAFVIDIDATSYEVAGVTRDASGTPVGSVQVSLFKHGGSGVFEYIGTQLSNATTGAYSFTVYEHPASFMVYAHLAGSPNTFDCSDRDLTPV
ncbi:MAG: LamG domain-containing protein [Candidatus Competibacteraceae bacterium]|nr:LamG domain-containing protein [Candidatus Competibacteraceae bacterium]